MNFREIFRFEFVYQARSIRTWLYFAVLFAAAFQLRRGVVNSPFAIAQETILAGLLWVLMAPAVAGSAAARDAQTRMHPLVYTTPRCFLLHLIHSAGSITTPITTYCRAAF